jgi:5-methylcytosine-specific restriction enzyme subunit McrC
MTPGQRRTITLRERIGRECRLHPDDVAFLLAGRRDHVELLPTGRRGRYRLTPLGHVGTIVCPGCRLRLLPKIPVRNLFDLLDPAGPASPVADESTPEPSTQPLDFLAGRLARLLAERAAAGLHRGYAEHAAEGRFLQGKLDVAAQLRESPARKDRLHFRHDDFTADVPCNQVPRGAAEMVLRSPLLGTALRPVLERALEGFASVHPTVLAGGQLALPQHPAEYRPLLDLCRLLVEGLSSGAASGDVDCPAFLLDMERVFEHYLTRQLTEHFRGHAPHLVVMAQEPFRANEPGDRLPDLVMIPDVLVSRDGAPLLVVDAKWKRLRGTPLVRDDVYQMLAYCTALGVGRAVLVYPGRRDRAWHYRLARAPVRVTVRTLRVVGSREALGRAAYRLGRSIGRQYDST